MCWNQYVSINTFVFGIFGILLIAFNNQYSDYKLKFFQNAYAYVFMLSFIFMQLFEFILWRNLDNQVINRLMSILGFLLLAFQPFASLLLLNNIPFRNKLLLAYAIPALIFVFHNLLTTNIFTKVSPAGHLQWNWTSYKNITLVKFLIIPFFLFFLFFSLLYNKYYYSLLVLFLYFLSIYYYGKDGTSASIWCFSVNATVLYFVIQILFVMPYSEITKKS